MISTVILQRWTQSNNPHRSEYEQQLPSFLPSTRINKCIFQICLRGKGEGAKEIMNSLPDKFITNILGLQEMNPEWEYFLLGDREAEEFIIEHYGEEIFRYYTRIDRRYGSARADFLKSLLLYAKGGFYLDLKSNIKHPLSEAMDDRDGFCAFFWDNEPKGRRHCLIPDSAPNGEYLMGIMAAPKGHPYLREVILETMRRINHYDPYSVGVGWTGVQLVTGPAMFTDVICRCQHDMPKQPFKLARPFSDFGFQLSFQEQEYSPGIYQNETGMTNYRSLSVPVVCSTNRLVQAINELYLRLMKAFA